MCVCCVCVHLCMLYVIPWHISTHLNFQLHAQCEESEDYSTSIQGFCLLYVIHTGAMFNVAHARYILHTSMLHAWWYSTYTIYNIWTSGIQLSNFQDRKLYYVYVLCVCVCVGVCMRWDTTHVQLNFQNHNCGGQKRQCNCVIAKTDKLINWTISLLVRELTSYAYDVWLYIVRYHVWMIRSYSIRCLVFMTLSIGLLEIYNIHKFPHSMQKKQTYTLAIRTAPYECYWYRILSGDMKMENRQ